MLTGWMFFFGGVLCLMFLGMLYGDRFSLVGLFDGRWLNPLARVVSEAWEEFLRGLDDALAFVAEHSSWVIATASGTAGLTIVAFLMFSGLASDASAVHRDEATPLRQGGVLDAVPEITARVPPSAIRLASARLDESQFVQQMPGGSYYVFSPRPARRTIDDLPPFPERDRPEWNLSNPELRLTLNRSSLRGPETGGSPVLLAEGRLIERPPISLARLGRDGWRMRDSLRGWNPRDLVDADFSGMPLPESSREDAAALESGVTVVPGQVVAASDLRVEKSWPEATSDRVDLEIRLVNIGDATVHGVLVREMLPFGTEVLERTPDAVLRNDVITWLVDALPPFEEVLLTCTVRPPDAFPGFGDSQFDSRTEVSAAVAVTSPVEVRPDRALRPVNAESAVPDVARRPDVRLRIDEPPAMVEVSETIEVFFNVTNVGDAPAEDVLLRVTLDAGLDHHTLNDTDVDRRIENAVRRLAPGATQRLVLRIRATTPGEHLATAEMIFEDAQLALSTFRIVATEPLLPADDESGTRRPDSAGQRNGTGR